MLVARDRMPGAGSGKLGPPECVELPGACTGACGTTYPPRAGVSVIERRRMRSPSAPVRGQREARRDRREDLAHLERRERGAEAAARAAAERDERVRLRRAVEEALGPERRRVLPQVGAAVRQVDARRDMDARRERPAADLERLQRLAADDRQHGPHAQDLLDHGLQVRVVARAHAREDVGVAGQPLERPAERARGRLVAGGQQRDELVADLARAWAASRPRGAPRAARRAPTRRRPVRSIRS